MLIKGKKYRNLTTKEMMDFYGFEGVKTTYLGIATDSNADGADNSLNYKDTHKIKVAIGYKNIEYRGLQKTVIGVFIRGTSEDDDWDSDFDIGDVELREAILKYSEAKSGHNYYKLDAESKSYNSEKIDALLNDNIHRPTKYDSQYNAELSHFAYGYPDWLNKQHHAGFDIASNRVLEVLKNYMEANEENMNEDICYWVAGHSMGGGVANLVAAGLINGAQDINYRSDNIYCYTFAAPNTFYITDNREKKESIYSRYSFYNDNNDEDSNEYEDTVVYREPKGPKYRCIFNIGNEDDFVPKLPMEECGWTRYGRVAKLSIKKEKAYYQSKLDINSYYNLLNFLRTYKGNPDVPIVISNAMSNVYKDKKSMRYEAY